MFSLNQAILELSEAQQRRALEGEKMEEEEEEQEEEAGARESRGDGGGTGRRRTPALGAFPSQEGPR